MAGMTFTYELEKATWESLCRRLEQIAGSKARVYIARALNKTATTTRVRMISKMQAAYTVKTGGARSDLRLSPANAGNLVAIMRSNGTTLHVNKFHWSTNGGSHGVRIDVVRSGLKEMHHNGNKAFVYRQARRSKADGGKGGYSNLVFAREGSARLPIAILKSKSVPYMFGSHRVWTPMTPQVQSDLEHYMLQQIEMLLGGG